MIMEEVLLEVDAEIFKDEMGKCWDSFQNSSVERSISKVARDSQVVGQGDSSPNWWVYLKVFNVKYFLKVFAYRENAY